MHNKLTKLKKRSPAKPELKPAPVEPLTPPMLFERIGIKTFKGTRGLIARILKFLLNGQLSPELARTALPYLHAALSINHAIQLKQRLDAISHFMEMPPSEDPEAEAEEETEPDDEPDAPEED
jgi:hypothetical protein